MAKLRRAFDGTGPWSGFGAACWLAALIGLGTILLSTNGVDWWLNVHSVQGRDLDGLVYYSVNGVSYSIIDPHSFAGSRPHPQTVYYIPSQPGNGSLHNAVNEVADWSLTAGPAAIGLVLILVGVKKRWRQSRRSNAGELRPSFGQGIPPETIRAILAQNDNRQP